MTRERTVRHVDEGQGRSASGSLRTLQVEVVRGPDAGRRIVAESETVSVGTADGNELVLTDDTVSRYHLELVRAGDHIVVRDLGSTNGTAIGAALIERARVPPGSVLVLGKSAIKVDDGETVSVELFSSERLGGLRGRSAEMLRLLSKVERASKTDASVLVVGETGTGKEVIAHALHDGSRRARRPFETVDCGALLPTLVASELFGHEKGAFTGADRQHVGAFERADGGTIFLDEIGELPPALQPALLGALERRTFKRVGGTKPITVDVRVISATHRDLRAEVNAGAFRQDLYYRLAVVHLAVPPLRERAADIPLLVEHFLDEEGFDGDVDDVIPARAMEALAHHHWPGNVRELRNFVEAALAMGEAPPLSDAPSPRPPEERRASPGSDFEPPAPELLADLPYGEARAALLREFEGFYLRRLLERTKGNVSLASREAKMNRSHLIRMLKRHELK